ncbi:hypothetical protein K469DRAFT_715782 [Zopfia rhizophila CBS 207.26]|uniref:Uncharacterized protein n=1 Tax=Zopfia rhizophila CBS 207.26 TaxID=1314779 RepID=A0A6A6DMF1_9PEZI|nr:hypothetical protein K469DRAFT_715782 [Zopfia rhizophila CBS 207.26]
MIDYMMSTSPTIGTAMLMMRMWAGVSTRVCAAIVVFEVTVTAFINESGAALKQ